MHIDHIRHSLAHLLAMAVLKKFPKAKLGIGPVIEHGFYYDFKLSKPLSDTDLPELEKIMRGLVAQKLAFKGQRITAQKAKMLFKSQPFKLDLIKEFTKEKRALAVYHTGGFADLCRGGHVKNTSEINPDAFRLTHTAGAYWRGDEKNPQLTRIYGAAFAAKEELDQHLASLDEAKRRDHKKLGVELDLFTFSELVGPGLPLWTPKGTALRDILDNLVWKLRAQRGYERVDIPHLAKRALYETSGHWEKFRDELFKIVSREGHEFVLKPMNCPHHIQIYRRKQFSWRKLPQRYASTTKVYRDEQTGELSGLARVRAITQDDAHVFCRRSQAKEEILKIWEIVTEFYKLAGFNLRVRLSLRDPKHPMRYLGSPKIWQESEQELLEIIREKNAAVEEAPGEAAFYGPKIDFLADDSLGREWQLATIQLDMNLPERFDLYCINEEGERERIVILHAAIMGAIERYVAILIEHYAGAFPLWLAPVQVAVLPISEKFQMYGQEVADLLRSSDIRVELRVAAETLGRRIREAEMEKIPYLLIVGQHEVQTNSVSIRKHGEADRGEMPLAEFITQIRKETNQ